MSNDELSQLFYLKREIQLLQREIKCVSAMRLFSEAYPARADLLDFLRQRLSRCQAEYNRGIAFIQAIPDAWTQTAFRLRYVQSYSWAATGSKMGLAPDCCRQMVHRYLKRHGAGASPPNSRAAGDKETAT